MIDDYKNIVEHLESNLADYAMKSFDSRVFVDGGDIFQFYNNLWEKGEDGRFKLNSRTPIQHQRDKILYSSGVRKQSEKYHVIFRGSQRIIRNYITHTMRMMQVSKTICRALRLNEDFAEALVLGTKVGALPFIHASKNVVSDWIQKKIIQLDAEEQKYSEDKQKQLLPMPKEDYLPNHPSWIRNIRDNKIKTWVMKHIPFASGKKIEEAYSSGKQSYWSLTTNPYTNESLGHSFTPELMYGIWRHSLDAPFGKDTFLHNQEIDNAASKYHKVEWKDVSYESIVVQYADDITWVIENLNDSNIATVLNNPQNRGLFQELLNEGSFDPPALIHGLSKADSGKLYSYFINDFIDHSKSILGKKEEKECKFLLKDGDKEFKIGLSKEGNEVLNQFKIFLEKRVFNESRVFHRKKMLETITDGCLDLLYRGKNEYLIQHINIQSIIEGWTREQQEKSLNLVDNQVFRIQLSVNVFSEMSDQQIFSFIGMDSF
jgi:dGTP triphosphohydrolase